MEKINKEEFKKQNKNDFKDFLDKLEPIILSNEKVNANDIFESYFKCNPPFEKSKFKKHEFPDAFIAEQIKMEFNDGRNIMIISADKGFKESLKGFENFTFFENVSDLYNELNKRGDKKKKYDKIVQLIKSAENEILEQVQVMVKDNNYINAIGTEYDSGGIENGYEYTEASVENVDNMKIIFKSIDDIQDNKFIVRLQLDFDITVLCYYEDYENAIWDSENRTYLYLDVKKI